MANVTAHNCTHYLKFLAQVQSAELSGTVSKAIYHRFFSSKSISPFRKKRKRVLSSPYTIK